MAFCFLGIETEGVVALEDGGYLVLEQECALPAGGRIVSYGHIPNWWDGWRKDEARRIRMRKSTADRLAELTAQEFGKTVFREK